MTVTLTKNETAILTEAAGREVGSLLVPDTMKEVTAQRLIGKLLKLGLITASGADHLLTPAGYGAVGLEPPQPVSRSNKKVVVAELLGRQEGASLGELIAATGWLPHTTRAALSRIRSAGTALLKSKREDGATAYRIAAEEPTTGRRPRKPRAEAVVEVAA